MLNDPAQMSLHRANVPVNLMPSVTRVEITQRSILVPASSGAIVSRPVFPPERASLESQTNGHQAEQFSLKAGIR